MAARLVHSDHDLLDLDVREGHATLRTLHTTSNHPFWDDTLHAWVAAGRLVPGHSLITADNRHVVVADVVARPGAAEMYNLTVTELHTGEKELEQYVQVSVGGEIPQLYVELAAAHSSEIDVTGLDLMLNTTLSGVTDPVVNDLIQAYALPEWNGILWDETSGFHLR
ncbi:polymorphic toxin-type HINT domain-containing protein [Streptomyces sp. NPDC058676]|uniref:polymorphic toxin-type HINT domain-containing protein n=1 Tax=unclassified Streptomyces TaxID=2593676 RepID=UPI003653F242